LLMSCFSDARSAGDRSHRRAQARKRTWKVPTPIGLILIAIVDGLGK
jgi:hypothetical protein